MVWRLLEPAWRETFELLVLTQILWAFGSTFRSGAEIAWFTDEVGSVDLVDSILPRRASYESAGSIFGVMISAAFASVVGLTIAMIAVGALLIAWGIGLVFRMPETGFVRPGTSTRVLASLNSSETVFGLLVALRSGCF